MENQQVARKIIEQLGGNKFFAMTGAKGLLSEENKLHMTLQKNMSIANKLTITLDPDDTYSMKFYKFTMGRLNMKTFVYSENKEKEVKTFKGVFADQLQDIFATVTGMYASL